MHPSPDPTPETYNSVLKLTRDPLIQLVMMSDGVTEPEIVNLFSRVESERGASLAQRLRRRN